MVRRSIADPDDLAYYACCGPVEVPLAELVRVAGTRWVIEDAFKAAKQEVGLDEEALDAADYQDPNGCSSDAVQVFPEVIATSLRQ